MKRIASLLPCLIAAALLAVPAPAAANCYAVGQRIAAERGGSLAAAQAEVRGGRQVCVIVVLVPGADGKRPRRQEIVVPQ
jgi:hypothetical protein